MKRNKIKLGGIKLLNAQDHAVDIYMLDKFRGKYLYNIKARVILWL